MKVVIKRSIIIAGHKTSVSLEDAFWSGLKQIASGRGRTLSELVSAIDAERPHGNLSSTIRLFVLDYYRNMIDTPADVENFPGGSPTRSAVWQSVRDRGFSA